MITEKQQSNQINTILYDETKKGAHDTQIVKA